MYNSFTILLCTLVLSLFIGINAYQPTTLQLFTFNSYDARNEYLLVDLTSGKGTPNQQLPDDGSNILGTLTPVDDEGNTLLISNIGGSIVAITYNPQTQSYNQTYTLSNFVPYEMTSSPWGYDSFSNVAYHATLAWNSPSANPTYLSVLICDFENNLGSIVEFNVSVSLGDASIVGTYDQEDSIYFAYYSDSTNTDHIIAYDVISNTSVDYKLNNSVNSDTTPTIVELFYYDDIIYIAKMTSTGVTITGVDTDNGYTTTVVYSNTSAFYTNTDIPFVFDENGFIIILNFAFDLQTFQPIIFNLATGTATTGNVLPNNIPTGTWIINSIPSSN